MPQNHGLKIGSNILTNTDKELNFSSEYSTLKFYKWGNAQFTTDGSGNGTVSILHDLKYSPIAMVFRNITPTWSSGGIDLGTGSANSFCNIASVNHYAGGILNSRFTAYTDANYLVIVGSSVTPSTTYNFRYYILVDQSESYSSISNVSQTGNFGFKASKPDVSVETGKEYEMSYSSKYKAVQYYPSHIQTTTLTLPAMWANQYDTYVDEGTYVDFAHSLGYPPFFLAYYGNSPITSLTTIPYHLIFSGYPTFSVNGFSDSSKVRIYFWRGSTYDAGDVFDSWPSATTISVKLIMFTENLLGEASP